MTKKYTRPCKHCGLPMHLAEGGFKTVGLTAIKNPDQEADYHGHCRTDGRRAKHKLIKKVKKERSQK